MSKLLLLFCCFIVSFFNGKIEADEVPLSARYTVDTVWATAYQVSVKVANQSNQVVDDWTASFTIPQGNVLSSHLSAGEFSINGQNVTVKSLASNASIQPGASATFNMIIVMPQGGTTKINNLVAIGNTSGTIPPSTLAAPTLDPIAAASAKDYAVSWSKVDNATIYYLEMDTNSNFSNPEIIVNDNVNAYNFTNQPEGTYFFRVAAGTSVEKSSYSNVQSITLSEPKVGFPLIAAYKVDTVWASAFQATVTLTNNTNATASSWTANFSLPAGYTLSSHVSSGVFTANGQMVTVKNAASNGTIQPGESVTFNMIINMPSGAKALISNLQAAADGPVGPPPPPAPVPTAPTVSLQSTSDSSYDLSWGSVPHATSYILQEATEASFSNPKIVSQGNFLSHTFSNKPSGTYYYRVIAANSSGDSPYSNVVNITVNNTTPPPSRDTIEESVWYIDWTSWFTGPPYALPKRHVDMINIFVGELTYDANGKPTMGGFGTFDIPEMKSFVNYLKEQNPPIQAKVSIGGGGGMYDRTWDKLTNDNVKAFAQGMVDFCHEVGLAGVDFDYEAYGTSDRDALVGTLIKEFKLLDPNLQTSLCSNAGFGDGFPWQAHVKNILDAAMISPGNCAVDRFYIMSYYNTMQDEIGWIVGADGKGGWTNWLITNYGFTRARISVGLDDFDAWAYDLETFRAWALENGFSTAHWAFDPARPK